MTAHFDVVVVGSGSTGGTVAARLSEDPTCRVALVEAGPDFPDDGDGRLPAFFAGGSMIGERGAGSGVPSADLDWGFVSEPLPDGRRVELPRGRLVGGSSMTNGTVAVRGRPGDFARWVDAGATGWGWDDVLPFYEAAERELSIKTYPREQWLPVQELFASACLEIGFRYHGDLNDPDAWDGVVGPWPRNRRNEIRQGSLVTYIRQARGRANFTLLSSTLVDRVIVEGGRARGVAVVDDRRSSGTIAADHVVLSAGTYGTPPILLRSGIGMPSDLATAGVDCHADLPVGHGVLEHPGYRFVLDVDRRWAAMGWPSLAVVARGDGWWGIPTADDEERGVVSLALYLAIVAGPEGTVGITTSDPTAPPVIDHRYADYLGGDAFDGIRRDFDRLLATSSMHRAGARDVHAGLDWQERLLRGISTGTHPVGGCSIGRVVDAELAVIGVDGISVADASVFPRHVTNNPNLTCHMIGELAAVRIAARLRGAAERPVGSVRAESSRCESTPDVAR